MGTFLLEQDEPPRPPEECGDFKRGNCTRGDRCKYLHVSAKLGRLSPLPSRQGFEGEAGGFDEHGNALRNWKAGPQPLERVQQAMVRRLPVAVPLVKTEVYDVGIGRRGTTWKYVCE